jgi:hypothetical protein
MPKNNSCSIPGPSAPKSRRPLANFRGLAEFVNLDERTVANPAWRKRLELPFYRINARCIRFDLDEVAAHLRAKCHHEPLKKEIGNGASQ